MIWLFADNSIMAHHWAAWWMQFHEYASKFSLVVLNEETLILKHHNEFIIIRGEVPLLRKLMDFLFNILVYLSWILDVPKEYMFFIQIKLALFSTSKKKFVAYFCIIGSYHNLLWRKDQVMILFKEQMWIQLHFTTLGILSFKTTWHIYGIGCNFRI